MQELTESSVGASRSATAHWALSERLRFWMHPMVAFSRLNCCVSARCYWMI